MKWLRRKFTDLSRDWQFGILAGIGLLIAAAVLVVLTGCTSLTKQVYTPTMNPESEARCVIVYDKVRWNLAKDGPCKGEARI